MSSNGHTVMATLYRNSADEEENGDEGESDLVEIREQREEFKLKHRYYSLNRPSQKSSLRIENRNALSNSMQRIPNLRAHNYPIATCSNAHFNERDSLNVSYGDRLHTFKPPPQNQNQNTSALYAEFDASFEANGTSDESEDYSRVRTVV